MLEQKVDDLKVQAIRTKQEVWENIKKCLSFNHINVIGYRLVSSSSFV